LRLANARTEVRAATAITYCCAGLTLFFGIRKLTQLGLSEKDLFFGILLVLILSVLMSVAGLMLQLMARLSFSGPSVERP